MNERIHDILVNFAAHPAGWPLARISRRIGNVIYVPGFGTIVNDASLAHDILIDDTSFTKNGQGSLADTITSLLGPFALGNMDGEKHRMLRTKLRDVFSPAQSALLLESQEDWFEALAEDIAQGKSVDIVDWIRILSGRLTFDMLGVRLPDNPHQACRELVLLGESIASGIDFRKPHPDKLAVTRQKCERLADYIRLGYESASSPPKSLIFRLRTAGLTFDEAKGVLSLVFLAGTLTTAAAFPRIVGLLIDSGRLPTLQRTDDWIPPAVAEGLRYVAPVPATVRIAQRDVLMQGRRIAKSERMIILTCNLARDPTLFAKPDVFDPQRQHDPRSRNLWFGAGPHFCLGFSLAQQQLRRALEALTSGNHELEIVSRRYGGRAIVPSYKSLVLRATRPS